MPLRCSKWRVGLKLAILVLSCHPHPSFPNIVVCLAFSTIANICLSVEFCLHMPFYVIKGECGNINTYFHTATFHLIIFVVINT